MKRLVIAAMAATLAAGSPALAASPGGDVSSQRMSSGSASLPQIQPVRLGGIGRNQFGDERRPRPPAVFPAANSWSQRQDNLCFLSALDVYPGTTGAYAGGLFRCPLPSPIEPLQGWYPFPALGFPITTAF